MNSLQFHVDGLELANDDDDGLGDDQLTGLGGWFPRRVLVVSLPMAKEVFPAETFFSKPSL